jgi:hypothetical protein
MASVSTSPEGGFYPVEWFDLICNATLEQPKYHGLTFTDNVGGKPVFRDYDGNQLIRVPKASLRVVPGVNLFDHAEGAPEDRPGGRWRQEHDASSAVFDCSHVWDFRRSSGGRSSGCGSLGGDKTPSRRGITGSTDWGGQSDMAALAV